MSSNKFTFEQAAEHESNANDLANNFAELKRRLKLTQEDGDQMNAEEVELMKSFCSNNIRNISYYEGRIAKENKKRFWYSVGTMVLLVVIPLSVFLITYLFTKETLDGLETTTGLVTTVLAVVLGLHKFVSEWLDARKFRSIFHQAKVDLQNVLYALIEDNASQSIAQGYDREPNSILSEQLVQALKDAIRRSREIVNTEAKAYFELSASPSFDLSGTLSSASSSAKDLFNGFKSKRFKDEMLAAEARESGTEWRTAQKDLVKKSAEMKVIDRRLERLELERAKLCELMKRSNDPEQIEKYRTEFDIIDDEYEDLGAEKYLLEKDRDYSNFVMDTYDGKA